MIILRAAAFIRTLISLNGCLIIFVVQNNSRIDGLQIRLTSEENYRQFYIYASILVPDVSLFRDTL